VKQKLKKKKKERIEETNQSDHIEPETAIDIKQLQKQTSQVSEADLKKLSDLQREVQELQEILSTHTKVEQIEALRKLTLASNPRVLQLLELFPGKKYLDICIAAEQHFRDVDSAKVCIPRVSLFYEITSSNLDLCFTAAKKFRNNDKAINWLLDNNNSK